MAPKPSMHILGIPINNLSVPELEGAIDRFLREDRFHRIATVNPEFLLLSQKNAVFRQSILSADLRVVDGVGLHLPFWLAGEELRGRYPGADLVKRLVSLAEERKYSIGLLLRPDGISAPDEIRHTLKTQYPKLIIADVASQAVIVFSNLGAPLQEILLAGLAAKPGTIRLAMGVGGSFDYLTGKIPRAPKFIRTIGLEWLWRLIQQPQRFQRIWNAVIIFPWKVLSQK